MASISDTVGDHNLSVLPPNHLWNQASHDIRILMDINHASVAFDRYMRVGSVVRQSCNVRSYTVAYCLCSCACSVKLVIMRLALSPDKKLSRFLYLTLFQSFLFYET